eukprot:SAG11_NODE_2659_length_3120_cov_2.024164_4_plen_152_part_00
MGYSKADIGGYARYMVDEALCVQLLRLCPRITTLGDHLCGKHVSSELLAMIGRSCIDLDCLRITNSNIVSVEGEGDAAAALAPVLHRCTHLHSIAIGLTTSTDDGVANMIARWQSGGALRECKIVGGHISTGAMRRLRAALGAGCKVTVDP